MLKLFSIISILSNIFLCKSHSYMGYPVCRRSKYSSYYVNKKLVDYNIMAPLNTYGYTFPCKGFPEGPAISTVKSNNLEIIIEPKAPIHGGGHCQFGITYDSKTFIVLKQVISTCLLNDNKYEMILPKIPNGKLTIFWTSINAIGNREYYMDCADVEVKIPDNIVTDNIINGKELIVVNLPGYKIIPEFPEKDMYDGRELLKNAKNIIYKIKEENTFISPTTHNMFTTNYTTTYTTNYTSNYTTNYTTTYTANYTANYNNTVYNYSLRNNFNIYYFLIINFAVILILN